MGRLSAFHAGAKVLLVPAGQEEQVNASRATVYGVDTVRHAVDDLTRTTRS